MAEINVDARQLLVDIVEKLQTLNMLKCRFMKQNKKPAEEPNVNYLEFLYLPLSLPLL